ncbi:uncharacterized protein EI90DRAFT_2925472 [Cantharellus anzutake]|uniref:uncharacterized protein n=1 Tax=Cantharellus anzutake TaxID=1750568 RepID=UPI001904B3A4|nr:uncharacterized protein EI90DRAFT_2925472 [Cantharellus anzutake]KAF8328663.1 hypothetical protein EI90DRAFT_2925472 [Cantharellus anzutake]
MLSSYPPRSVLPTHRTTYSGRSRLRLRFLLLIGISSFFFFIWLIHAAAKDKWFRDLGYITRPIWDTSNKKSTPQRIVPHYDVSDYNATAPTELCSIHGWEYSSGPSTAKVYDAVLYSIEIDLLEIRLHELWDVVDTFVIAEASRAFSGELRENLIPLSSILSPSSRLHWASSKIKYELVQDLDPSPKDPFDNERQLRHRMDSLLYSAGVKANDIVIMSDVDEIPTPHTISLLKQCSTWPSPIHLQMKNYRYSFEYPIPDDGYWRPKAVRWGGPGSNYNHAKGGDVMLANAGWHCSWCFRYIEDIQFKMTGYSHNDRLKGKHQIDPKRINKHTCEGSDIFDMYPEAFSFYDLIAQSGPLKKTSSFTDIPNWLVRHPKDYEFLLPGGCEREHRPTAE